MADRKYDPKKLVSPKLYAEALAAVNEFLKFAGKPTIKALPVGVGGNAHACPLFFALKSTGVEEVSGSEMIGTVNIKCGTKKGKLVLEGVDDDDEGLPMFVGTVDVCGIKGVVVKFPGKKFPQVDRLLRVADRFVSAFDTAVDREEQKREKAEKAMETFNR